MAVPVSPRAAEAAAREDEPLPRVRAAAPAVVPAEILSEKDPARRAGLQQMHELAMARVRLNTLQRRQMLLSKTLQRARSDGSWSSARIAQAEADLVEINAAIGESEKAVDRLGRVGSGQGQPAPRARPAPAP